MKPQYKEGFFLEITEGEKYPEFPGLMMEMFDICVNVSVLRPGSMICVPEFVNKANRVLVIQDFPTALYYGYKHRVAMRSVDRNDFYPPEFLKEGTIYEYVGNDFPNMNHWNNWIYNHLKV